jgi:hypothetical protein
MTDPIETAVEIIPPRFDLRQAKSETYQEKVSEVMQKTGLQRWQVEGVLADLVMQNKSKESQMVIAERWGVSFGNVTSCRNMGRLTIDECRGTLGTKAIAIANAALDAAMDDFNDPDRLAKLSTKDKVGVARSMSDCAINLENKATGQLTQNNISVGDIAVLIQHKADREKHGGGDAMARLLAKGLAPEIAEKAKE